MSKRLHKLPAERRQLETECANTAAGGGSVAVKLQRIWWKQAPQRVMIFHSVAQDQAADFAELHLCHSNLESYTCFNIMTGPVYLEGFP